MSDGEEPLQASGEIRKAFLACMYEEDPLSVLQALQEGRVGLESVYQQYTLLQVACSRNRIPLARALLRLGADINRQSQVCPFGLLFALA